MRTPILSDCGILDIAISKVISSLGPRHERFFSKGWGDLEAVHKRRDQYYEQVRAGNVTVRLRDEDITWHDSKIEKKILIDEGSFLSPLHDLMPEECKRCHFHLVHRKKQSYTESGSQVYVIMLSSTGEVGRRPRLAMARKLAKNHGFACVILSTAFYGRRKPPSQHSFYLETVSDMWKQYGGVIQESAAMAEYFLSKNPDCKVCLTGFSAGACLSICAAWTCMVGYRIDGSRISVAAHATPESAGVFASGCVQHLMDWNALRGEEFEERETTRNRLFDELDLLSVRAAFDLKDPTNEYDEVLGSIRCTLAVKDLISPRQLAESLEQLVPAVCKSHVFHWLRGGHVYAYIIRRKFHNRLIVKAVQPLLEESTVRTA